MLGLECLATIIFFEARDQPLLGQYAVASVVMNRVTSERWPNDICSVMKQKDQFSFYSDGQSDNIEDYTDNKLDWKAAAEARMVALKVFEKKETGTTTTHYHSVNVLPSWAKHYKLNGQIGDHLFYTASEGK